MLPSNSPETRKMVWRSEPKIPAAVCVNLVKSYTKHLTSVIVNKRFLNQILSYIFLLYQIHI